MDNYNLSNATIRHFMKINKFIQYLILRKIHPFRKRHDASYVEIDEDNGEVRLKTLLIMRPRTVIHLMLQHLMESYLIHKQSL